MLTLFGRVIFAAFVLGGISASKAANTDTRTSILCVVQETRSMPWYERRGQSSLSRPERARQRLADWYLNNDASFMDANVEIRWRPRAAGPPSLKIIMDGEDRKTANVISVTKDTLIATIITSDRFTSRSWLFNINFHTEDAIATQFESNIGGAKGILLGLSCQFNDLTPVAPGNGKTTG